MSEAHANVVELPQHGRTPPHNLDAERSLLGGLLLDGLAIDDVLEVVRGPDFYRDAHRRIFEAMVDCLQRSQPIDRITVKDALTRGGFFETVGGDDYLDLLDKIVPTAANLAYYAKIIADKSLARRAVEAASQIAQLGYEQHGDVHEFVDEAESRFFALRDREVKGELKTLHQTLPKVFLEIERRSQHDGSLVGVTSGLERLDDFTGGLRPGNLVVIAARPSMGKSALGLGIARAVAETGGAAPFFSLEMSEEELTIRLLSDLSGIDSKAIAKGKLLEKEWARLALAAGKLDQLPLHLCVKDRMSAVEIRAHCRRLAKRLSGSATPLKAVVVDYLQKMKVDESSKRMDLEVGKNTAQLKDLAQQLGVPVILLAQLNREVERRPNKRPMMSDLRESGAIEQDADVIVFIYRDEVYNKDTEDKGVAELILAKQRNGPTGTVRVGWVAEMSAFRNLYGDASPAEQKALPLREEPPHPADDSATRYP